MTTNGTGMGHLSRQVAIGAALAPTADPVLFSLSTAIAQVLGAGSSATGGGPAPRGEYVPSYHRNWMPVPQWHGYLRDRLVALVRELDAQVVAFDGVAPYLGLLRARAMLPDVPFMWFRRGMWRPGSNTAALRAVPFFDVVVEPGDLAASADRGATAGRTDAVAVPPVTAIGRLSQLDRAAALTGLGLDPERPAVLVNLGGWAHRPGRPGGGWWSSPAGIVVAALLAGTDWQIALIRTPILTAEVRAAQTDRLHVIGDVYPLAGYLRGFTAAVAEAGYNGFHELLLTAVPTLFLPKSTRTDDQHARARWAAATGVGLYAPERGDVPGQLARLMEQAVRVDLATVAAQLPREDGAAAAAELLAGQPRDGFRHRASVAERRRVAVLESKARIAQLIGPAATDRLRALRRPAPGSAGATAGRRGAGEPARRRAAGEPARRIVADPAIVTDLTGVDLLAPRPVEHVLAGTSAHYLAVRTRLARSYYAVPPGWQRPQLGG